MWVLFLLSLLPSDKYIIFYIIPLCDSILYNSLYLYYGKLIDFWLQKIYYENPYFSSNIHKTNFTYNIIFLINVCTICCLDSRMIKYLKKSRLSPKLKALYIVNNPSYQHLYIIS